VRHRKYLVVVLTLVLGTSCSHHPERRQHPELAGRVQVGEPGYACEIEDKGTFGVISSNFGIADSGPRREVVLLKWDAGDGNFANPWITAFWLKLPGKEFAIGAGHLVFDPPGGASLYERVLRISAFSHCQ